MQRRILYQGCKESADVRRVRRLLSDRELLSVVESFAKHYLRVHDYTVVGKKSHLFKDLSLFCFVDQLPKGMRETLYVKDDDYRLSFVSGNYVTLSTLSVASQTDGNDCDRRD